MVVAGGWWGQERKHEHMQEVEHAHVLHVHVHEHVHKHGPEHGKGNNGIEHERQ
jgi:hypothetical protein